MQDKDLLKYIDNLEEENKRLRKSNENTIKIKVEYSGAVYEVDTQIIRLFKENNDYYIPTDYKEPLKVKFIDYVVEKSVDNRYLIFASVYNYKNKKIEYIDFRNLLSTKEKASKEYLLRKERL